MSRITYGIEELTPIVAQLAASYTGYEHSSITYERAQTLMGAVIYCIREYAQAGEDDRAGEDAWSGKKVQAGENGQTQKKELAREQIPAREAYQIGYQKVFEKAEKLQVLYHEALVDFRDYGMECLKSTVMEGIPGFLLKYDAKYAPQETILTLDYPILENLGKKQGVDAVYRYLQCICMEQRFLGVFEKGYVREVLRRYARGYECLFENICEIVLIDMLKPAFLKNTQQPKEELETEVEKLLNILIENHYENDGQLRRYFQGDRHEIVSRIYQQCRAKHE